MFHNFSAIRCWISHLRRKLCFSTCFFPCKTGQFFGLHVEIYKFLSDYFKSCWYIWALEMGGSMIRRWQFFKGYYQRCIPACVPYEWGPCPFMEPKLQRRRVLGSVTGSCNIRGWNEETPQGKQDWIILSLMDSLILYSVVFCAIKKDMLTSKNIL